MTNEEKKNPSMQAFVMGFIDSEGEARLIPHTLHSDRAICEELGHHEDMRKYLAANFSSTDLILYSVLLTELTPISRYKSPPHRPEEAGE